MDSLLLEGQVGVTGHGAAGYARVTGAAYLRMRSGPGYGYQIKAKMPKGAIVELLSGPHDREWYRVSYRGMQGYAAYRWLARTDLVGTGKVRGDGKMVVVSLASQQLEAYQDGQLALIAAITTGCPEFPTPTGITRVTAKFSPFLMVSPWPRGSPHYTREVLQDYAIRFRARQYYIHHAPRRPYFGYGTNLWHMDPDGVWRKGSFGCVNMPSWSAARLFEWIEIGTSVQVTEG